MKIYHANTNQKNTRVAILLSDKVGFRARKITRDKEGHYLVIKGSILQEDIIIPNMYAPNNRASKYMRQKLIELQGEIDESTIIVGHFNSPLSEMDRSSRQKISKDIVELNTTNQLDIIDIYCQFT